jgi:hypothetical protein
MTTKIGNKTAVESHRDQETAKARAELLRRAEAEGVRPFTSLEDFAGTQCSPLTLMLMHFCAKSATTAIGHLGASKVYRH